MTMKWNQAKYLLLAGICPVNESGERSVNFL